MVSTNQSPDYRELERLFLDKAPPGLEFGQFYLYLKLLQKWNSRINLTSVRSPTGIIERHFIDSLALLPYVPRGTILDIGSGAGFPGLPLKISRPNLILTLVESVKKKADFLTTLVRSLGLKGVTVISGRLENQPPLGPFDYVVSRAAMSLAELVRVSLPLVGASGKILALTSESTIEELGGLGPQISAGVPVLVEAFKYGSSKRSQSHRIVIVSGRSS